MYGNKSQLLGQGTRWGKRGAKAQDKRKIKGKECRALLLQREKKREAMMDREEHQGDRGSEEMSGRERREQMDRRGWC